ncbi:hypothetical protein ACLSU7_00925 [Bdellovibrio sp. HCB185ZH]|uniref:hypothetical protein n=1 Tax=Bdellovibrio sp. HCB185ZH TaxID=3394235 RepID=UPI0039A720F3
MNTMKSVFSLMIVSVAMVACTGNSGGGGGNPNNAVYPQPTVIGPYDQGQYPNQGGGYEEQNLIEPGTYNASIRCDNEYAQDRILGTSIGFILNQDGTYSQEVSADYRCVRNCLMYGNGTYTVNGASFTINQTRLVNEQGYELQGARSNTLQRVVNQSPRRKKTATIVLRDNGTENICGGPFTMSLKKQREQHRNDGRGN